MSDQSAQPGGRAETRDEFTIRKAFDAAARADVACAVAGLLIARSVGSGPQAKAAMEEIFGLLDLAFADRVNALIEAGAPASLARHVGTSFERAINFVRDAAESAANSGDGRGSRR